MGTIIISALKIKKLKIHEMNRLAKAEKLSLSSACLTIVVSCSHVISPQMVIESMQFQAKS